MFKNKLQIITALFAAAMVLAPECALAADNVFAIIATKMHDTVLEIRSIVYVIAGFGLIMFAVLAVFNKVSFKHLSYICIGLFLLSVMMPFINYFSGAQLSDQLSYGDYTSGDDAIEGSDIKKKDACGNELGSGVECPSIDTTTLDEGIKSTVPGIDEADLKLPGGETPENCAKGLNKKGTACKKTGKEVLNSIMDTTKKVIKTGKDAVAAGQNALAAANNVKQGIEAGVAAAKQVGEAIKNGEGGFHGILETATNVGHILGSGVDAVTSNATQAANRVANTVGNSADVLDDFSGGKNGYGDRVRDENNGFNQGLNQFRDAANQVHDTGTGVYNTGSGVGSINTGTKTMESSAEDLTHWFGN